MNLSLEGKRGIVLGVANWRSIAWGIAQALSGFGAEIGLTYHMDRLRGNVEALGEKIGASLVAPCDVGEDDQIERLFATVDETWGGLDFLIHSLAFANLEDLEGDYVSTGREGFHTALEICTYSLTRLCKMAAPLMREGGSVVTLSYLGAERVVPRYNVMGVAKAALESSVRYLAADLGPKGIRVNAISAGAVKTLAATAIPGFSLLLKHGKGRAPLRRNVTLEEIGNAAAFLASPASTGITGEVIHVDCGFHVLGM